MNREKWRELGLPDMADFDADTYWASTSAAAKKAKEAWDKSRLSRPIQET